jgi:SET domain
VFHSDFCPGQKKQWKSHHKQICKFYNNYVASQYFQMLPEHEKLDVLLLTHLVAEQYSKSQSEGASSPYSVFLSLMRRTRDGPGAPLICPLSTISAPPIDFLNDLYARFDNNNYVVHSHLTPYAHGIFPWASRFFNHSCSPNAVAKYIITACQPVRMEVVSLCEIAEGEEVYNCYYRGDPAANGADRLRSHIQIPQFRFSNVNITLK